MNPTVATVLGVVGGIISLVSIVFVVVTFIINRRKDDKEEQDKNNKEMNGISRSLLEMDLTLKQISNTTNETRTDIKTMNSQLIEHGKQIALMQRDIEELKVTKADR